jgi:hypothetical protein
VSPSPNANIINTTGSNEIIEMRALWDSGARYFSPLCAPLDSRVGGGSMAQGTADGNTFANGINSLYINVGPLLLPTSGGLMCYLDLEPAPNGPAQLSLAYWKGFATAVNQFEIGTAKPLFAALYCATNNPQPNCSVVAPLSGTNNCWGIDSLQPQPCTDCDQFANVYAPTPCPSNDPQVVMWQMTIQGGCTNTCHRANIPHGDTDQIQDSTTQANQQFHLTSRP